MQWNALQQIFCANLISFTARGRDRDVIAVRPAAVATCCSHAENANAHAVTFRLSKAYTYAFYILLLCAHKYICVYVALN